MGTPYKNNHQNLESPYARHLNQYPSQTEDFVPNEFAGKSRVHSTPHKQNNYNNHGNMNYQSNYNNSNNRKRGGNNRYFNVNRNSGGGGNSSGGNSGGGGYHNNQNNFQHNYNQQHQHRYSNSGNRQQPYYGQKFNKSDSNSRNDYYHPSMLVDPWKDLLERHNAIKNSQIDVPSPTATDQAPKEDDTSSQSSSSPDDAEADEAITTTKEKSPSPSLA